MLAARTTSAVAAPGPHATALLTLCAVWGLRLGLYLLWRWRKYGPDRRYGAMLSGAKDEDKARLQAIGESDRMTLLFRKRP